MLWMKLQCYPGEARCRLAGWREAWYRGEPVPGLCLGWVLAALGHPGEGAILSICKKSGDALLGYPVDLGRMSACAV